MEHNKNTTGGVGYTVTTPEFDGEERMNRFYGRAHKLIEDNFIRLRRERGGGMLTADYAVAEENGMLRVTLRQRMRICGRIAGEKTVTHYWKDGFIVKPKNKRDAVSRSAKPPF